MTHPTAYRRKARLIDHAAPPTPQEWLEHDARYLEDITAEIGRRAAGGDPAAAPWASPLYFDATARAESVTGRALLALRHLSGEAVARLVLLGRVLHGERTRPAADPAAERQPENDRGGQEGRVRRKEGSVSPPARGGRPIVAQLDGAEALAG
ncbi:hypothetical protein [Streptomyces sp. LUP30]|uniref:hypothetical protein n=2 Tax=unclassified Streptomyces TaxID=2593676 RepID=UPI000851A8D7|nr:hypothetical protein [Streptomyces sp. LUP30]